MKYLRQTTYEAKRSFLIVLKTEASNGKLQSLAKAQWQMERSMQEASHGTSRSREQVAQAQAFMTTSRENSRGHMQTTF